MHILAGSIAGVSVRATDTFVACAVLAGYFGAREVARAPLAEPISTPPAPDPTDLPAMADWLERAGASFGNYTPPDHPSVGWVILAGIGIVFVYVLSVLLHELGHLFAARRLGLRPSVLGLEFAGGFVEFEDDDRLTAGRLAMVVAAGPLVTALLAVSAVVATRQIGETGASAGKVVLEHVCNAAFLINASALALNLLPFRPLDGGQLLLAARLRLARAR